ncbi:uncharacterized protein LOC113357549 [Papaver somniferum]|uniref:uncharacterized protein LOC113357549 n=1 Tax=Papaver somniferum TaxID=3469 RepID=UPI000E6F6B21|nr:uncharacterized protein LOC113357549 [Papaver somniferum]
MQSSSPSSIPPVVSSIPSGDSFMGDETSSVPCGNVSSDPVIPPGFENFPPCGSTVSPAAWSSLFDKKKESVIPTDMEFYLYPVVDGKKSMDILYEVYDEDIRVCEDKVIGAFVGRRLPFNWVQSVVNRAWKPKGEIQMTIHGESMFIFDFKSARDRVRALEMGSMFIFSGLFIGKPCSRLVEKEIAELKSIHVWMNFRNVPLFMWSNKGLSMISSYLGKPLMMDTQTLNKTRMSYARICVEVDVNCDFPDSFTFTVGGIDTIEIKMDYSWKPPKCSECAVFGHVTANCPKHVKPIPKVVQKWVHTKTVNNMDKDGWILKSRNGAKTTDQLDHSSKNNMVFHIVIDAGAMDSNQGISEQNKENFQVILQATQQKASKPESSSTGSRAHFQKRGSLDPPAINLFPKIADLKKYARDNDTNNCFRRIWVGWDPNIIQVNLLLASSQASLLEVTIVTIVYGDNYYLTRTSLWNMITSFVESNSRPWVLLGDFNFIFVSSDKVRGFPIMPYDYEGFARCSQLSQLLDISFTGCFYNWTNCQQDGVIIRYKLDRVMVNMDWIQQFQMSKAEFLLPGISDHSPAIVSICENKKHGPPPFRFYNFLYEEEDFLGVARVAWNLSVGALVRRERDYVVEYVKLAKYEESSLKQQFRVKWLNMGDSNTPFFHNSLKERRYRNNILFLYNSENVKLSEDKDIANECVSYYSHLFGSDLEDIGNDNFLNLRFGACVKQDDVADLIKPHYKNT